MCHLSGHRSPCPRARGATDAPVACRRRGFPVCLQAGCSAPRGDSLALSLGVAVRMCSAPLCPVPTPTRGLSTAPSSSKIQPQDNLMPSCGLDPAAAVWGRAQFLVSECQLRLLAATRLRELGSVNLSKPPCPCVQNGDDSSIPVRLEHSCPRTAPGTTPGHTGQRLLWSSLDLIFVVWRRHEHGTYMSLLGLL